MPRSHLTDEQQAVRDKYRAVEQTTEFRAGDVMVKTITKTRPAIIDFADILTMVKIEDDDDLGREPPWKDCDGWEHEWIPMEKYKEAISDRVYSRFDGRADLSVDDLDKYITGITTNCWPQGHVGWSDYMDGEGVIVVDMDTVKKCWQGEYSHASGETRQRYEERMAACRKDALKTLEKWYTHGWRCYWIQVEFLGEEASVGGVYADDEDDEHLLECCQEVASEIAGKLEQRGYTIAGEPEGTDHNSAAAKARRFRDDVARHMGFDTYELYRKWVMTRPERPKPPPKRQTYGKRRTQRKLETSDG